MGTSFDELIRDLRKFEGRKEVTKQLRAEIRKPIPSVRAAIKRRALATLPKSGGLNVWVSRTKVTAKVLLTGRAAGVRLKGGRNSSGNRSDVRRIDAGKVRAPSWGRRGRDAWHSQQVPSGFFTEPATEVDQWRKACEKAVDKAVEVIRRG
ncbi:hypothetical protein [Micromonospora mirobrigensis]|uniref:Uncharacterized protein n=1 Tax=Micromonospora mirobrigensis TaxID=262898 RepID=A0A1C4XDJ3_9ACTN|nr:hypothetical protein [Micromonospora mirobrigensis]SCF06600.1 hypothetical protein GA0070564_10318 [Micromonospora mirobrigensis]